MAGPDCIRSSFPRKNDLASDFPGANNSLKALTLIQPFAQLCADGRKQIETRSWKTNYRGPLIIHAGKQVDRDFAADCGYDYLPTGAAVCIVDLWQCEPMPAKNFSRWLNRISFQEQQYGSYAPGRFAWHVKLMHVFSIPQIIRGYQGLWNFHPVEAERRAQVGQGELR